MLKNIQQHFLNSILNNSDNFDFISSPNADERIHIYRQTIIENIRNSLSIIYPGVWQLLGKNCADLLAKAFFLNYKNIPCSGCLDDYGHDFPVFLAQINELKHLYYLSDYAKYECLLHQLYAAKDCQSLDIISLQSISTTNLEKLFFSFVDACALFSSHFPLDLIKEILNNPSSSSINLSNRGSYALIVRFDNRLMTYWLEADLWYFIKLLKEGSTLKQATEQVQNQYSDFDTSKAILFVFEKKLIQHLKYK